MMKIYKAFPGGKHKVLTLSYDDGKYEDRKLVEIFNKYGIKATFNLNSGLIHDGKRINPSEWKDLYAGHEIAAHTYSHPTIDRCPTVEVIQELLEDRKLLEGYIGKPVRGIAYPNGSYSERIGHLASDVGFVYGRAVGDDYAMVHATKLANDDAQGLVPVGDETGFSLPSNFMEWKATCHHNHCLMEFGENFLSLHKKQYLYMMYVWGHSYEFEKDNNWDLMENFCQKMAHQPDIWYATNIEIVDYMDIFDRLQFAADLSFVHNPSAASAWFTVNDQSVEVKGGETISLKEYDQSSL